MPMVRAMRLLNAIEAGTLTGAQLQTLLTADPGRLAELNVLLGMRGQARRMAASSTAMNAVIASSAAKMAIFGSDTALAAIAASSTALAALRAAARYSIESTTASNSANAIPGTTAGASYILVGVSSSNAGSAQTLTNITTRRSGSSRPTTAAQSTNTTDAATVTLCTPLVAPFNFTGSSAASYTWYFGLLRCDV